MHTKDIAYYKTFFGVKYYQFYYKGRRWFRKLWYYIDRVTSSFLTLLIILFALFIVYSIGMIFLAFVIGYITGNILWR